MRIHLQATGCRLNEAELENWAESFQAQRHQIVRASDDAELIVFNTCAVTQQAVRGSRQTIRRLQRENPRAKMVVSGCYASLDPVDAAGLGVDLVLHNSDKDNLVEIANRELTLSSMPEAATQPAESALFARGRQRAFVKIQDGCRYRCTYCVVTLARGDERSRSTADIVADINRLSADGIKEVALTGVHVGGYGSDTDGSLHQLINCILRDTDIERLRLASVEPWDLPDDFFALFENSRFMPHMHLPLQSGSDSVLRRMSRRCKTDDFRQLIDQARREVPDFNVTTDIIVGFPGETESEWQQTLEFVESIGFGHCHIFSFSPRSGTKAAALKDQVDRDTKKSRSQTLHILAERMKSDYLARFLGRRFAVLIEGDGKVDASGDRIYQGYTPNYCKVEVRADASSAMTNQIVSAEIVDVADKGTHLLAVAG